MFRRAGGYILTECDTVSKQTSWKIPNVECTDLVAGWMLSAHCSLFFLFSSADEGEIGTIPLSQQRFLVLLSSLSLEGEKRKVNSEIAHVERHPANERSHSVGGKAEPYSNLDRSSVLSGSNA